MVNKPFRLKLPSWFKTPSWLKLPSWLKTRPMRWLRRILFFLLLGLLILLLLLAAVLLLPAGREAVLKLGLSQAERFVPGQISSGRILWPEMGRLELREVLWRATPEDTLPGLAPGDTLAFVPHLVLALDLGALRERELVVTELLVRAGPVDVPSIMALLPPAPSEAAAPDSVPDSPGSGGIPFLKPGSLPLVPSARLAGADLLGRRILLPDGMEILDAGLQVEAELRTGRTPQLVVTRGHGRLEQPTADGPVRVRADSLGLDLRADPEARTFHLRHLTLDIPEAGPDTLRAAWRQAGGVALRWAGRGSWTETGLSLELAGNQILPGPDHLRPLLPPEVPTDWQGPLRGHLRLEAAVPDLRQPDPRVRLDLDFSSTDWLDRLVLEGAYSGGRARVDNLELAALGTRLHLEAVVDTQKVAGSLRTALQDSTVLRRLGVPALAAADAALDLRLDVDGRWPVPGVDMALDARLRTPDLDLPRLEARVQGDAAGLVASLAMPRGLRAGTTTVDSLRVDGHGRFVAPDSLTFGLAAGAFSPLGKVLLGGAGEVGAVRSVRLDSLVITALDSTMRTQQPAYLTLGPGPRDWYLENLQLAGGLGTVRMGGGQQGAGLALDLGLDLLLGSRFLQEVVPNPLWEQYGGTDLVLRSSVDLGAGPTGPRFSGDAHAGLMPTEDIPPLSADLDFRLAQGPVSDSSGDSDSETDPGLGADLAIRMADRTLLRGSCLWPGEADMEHQTWVPDPRRGLQVTVPDQQLDLSWLNPYLPKDFAVTGTMGLGFVLRQDGGSAGLMDLVRTSRVQGHLNVQDGKLELPHRSRVALQAGATLAGPLQDPRLEGEVIVPNGFLRLPEMPPTLLPKQGSSYLWTAMARQDSLPRAASAGAVSRPGKSGTTPAGPDSTAAIVSLIPDLDLRVRVPGSLMLSGLGLNAELGGDVLVSRGKDRKGRPAPVLTGEMELVDGSLKFMNHVFRPEETRVRFQGAAPPNPMLDLLMAADVSGYRIILEVRGFANQPEIDLRSEPALDQTDIVAVLLFGQPINDLDNDQRGQVDRQKDPGAQLKQNLAAMAVVLGGTGVQNQVTSTLGVDMVDLGTDSQGGSTLMVGKFLTPRILLKYNKSLEKSGTYFMTLEYTLSRYFRLLSSYGQGEEGSGLELRWIRRD
ncbi:hypothetical protein CSB20_04435 [bacterium DOLZORAL124_64_63]|nr:MAG: hypothetical protein CSB20_04435 [bacterium DOLZORAL124_64_63]